MKAIYYSEYQGNISIESVPDPSPVAHGVVLKVKASGLCLSDWHGWMGHDKDIQLPHVPGHELSGKIVAIGKDVRKWKVGNRVTLPFVCGCGTCIICREGHPNICPDQFQPGFTHWGSFAEYVSIHYADANLVLLPSEISDEAAASLGCRFATSFRAVVDQAKVQKEEFLAVFGCGGVGLSAIMISQALGARVIALDTKSSALKKAAELGAWQTILIDDKVNVSEKIIDLTNGGAHVSLDAIGHEDAVYNGISSLRRRGRHVQIGILNPKKSNTPIPMDRVIAYELTVYGSHGMPAVRYDKMIEMILQKQLLPEKLIHSTITLAEGAQRLPIMNQSHSEGIQVINEFL